MMDKGASSNLDALRALAVTLVLVDHLIVTVAPAYSRTPWGRSVIHLGTLGVLMFFIHTSIVLMMSLARIEADGAPRPIARFYLRRVLRIYPLSIVIILLIMALHIPPVPWG